MACAEPQKARSVRSPLRSARANEQDRLAQVFDLLPTPLHGASVLRAVPCANEKLRVLRDCALSILDEHAICLALVVVLDCSRRRLRSLRWGKRRRTGTGDRRRTRGAHERRWRPRCDAARSRTAQHAQRPAHDRNVAAKIHEWSSHELRPHANRGLGSFSKSILTGSVLTRPLPPGRRSVRSGNRRATQPTLEQGGPWVRATARAEGPTKGERAIQLRNARRLFGRTGPRRGNLALQKRAKGLSPGEPTTGNRAPTALCAPGMRTAFGSAHA